MSELMVSGLAVEYPGKTVLRGVDLRVPTGSLTAVLGASGGGKTTLLRTIAGFLRPTAGQITVGGEVVAGAGHIVAPERRRVTIVPQEAALFPHLTVAANIGYGLPGWRTATRRARAKRVAELLDVVGLGGYDRHRPQQLSGGQQQRVALARALAPAPAAVLLDEPFSALDAGLRSQVRDQVRAILTELGTTAVLVTHDQDEALSMADQVAVLRDGQVAQVGSPEELYRTPVDLALAHFLGDAVQLPATAAGTTATTELGTVSITTAGHGAGTVMLRPEQLRVTAGPGAMTVVRVSFHGHDALLTVRTGSGLEVTARVPSPVPVHVGDEVILDVHGAGIFYPA
ncbi:ABC transporter ATP-binding protein [Nocardia rhizosphaerae]|uniref:ABC transporter ATP-binding protein n=1 Tax=Nocardia rhizosphaerae TaxID=1691571 RepID=A0ABV8L062_9NOCA